MRGEPVIKDRKSLVCGSEGGKFVASHISRAADPFEGSLWCLGVLVYEGSQQFLLESWRSQPIGLTLPPENPRSASPGRQQKWCLATLTCGAGVNISPFR